MTRPAAILELTPPKARPGRRKGHRITVQRSEQITRLCDALKLSGAVLTFRDAADELTKRAGFRVGVGTVYRFAGGEEPAGAKLRKLFGLPATVPVVACACGEVHIKKGRCPNLPKPQAPEWVRKAADWLVEAAERRGNQKGE